MNTKLFSEAISEVSDKYYEEAANYHCKKYGWIKWSAIEYQIVAEQIEAEEVVKVVSSIICGEEVFVDK